MSELGGKMQYSVTSTGQVHEFNEGEGGAAFQPILNNLNSEEEVLLNRRRTWSSPVGKHIYGYHK